MTIATISKPYPRITDNDKGLIHVSVDGHRIRDWIYANDAERRRMMSEARWYVEGWGDGNERGVHSLHDDRPSKDQIERLIEHHLKAWIKETPRWVGDFPVAARQDARDLASEIHALIAEKDGGK